MTAGELAQRAGLDRGHLSRIERGEVEPQARTVGKIAEALGIEVLDLYELEERLNSPKVLSPRRDNPKVLAWLADRRASWGVLTEEEFANRVLAQTALDPAAEVERVEDLSVAIQREEARVLRDLRREFSNPKARLFPDDLSASSAYQGLKRDLTQHYRLMQLALTNYASHILDGDEPEGAIQEALAEAAA